MKALKFAGFFFALLMAFVLFSPTSHADATSQMSQLTFSQPIQIPGGKVLPAGSYWFALAPGNYEPNVVVIYNFNRSAVEATLQTLPTYRMKTTDNTQLTFLRQSKNAPEALLKWFYPGFTGGHEFVYSNQLQNQLEQGKTVTLFAEPAPAVTNG